MGAIGRAGGAGGDGVAATVCADYGPPLLKGENAPHAASVPTIA